MAVLTNNINAQNIVDRFADFATTATDSISWGTNSIPFPEFDAAVFGGTTSGKPIGITGSVLTDTNVTASTIYNALVTETNTFTRIRNLRAILFVTGTGGNTGTRPVAGIVYDVTAVANMSASYLQNIVSPANANVASTRTITSANLESFFTNLRNSYNAARENTTTIQINVCHASCHSSCHASRSRR